MLMSCRAAVTYSHVTVPVKRADTPFSSPLPWGQQTPSSHSKLRNASGALKQNSQRKGCPVVLLLPMCAKDKPSFLLD